MFQGPQNNSPPSKGDNRGGSKTSVSGTASLDLAENPDFRPVFPGACSKTNRVWNKHNHRHIINAIPQIVNKFIHNNI
jgi:hypothetical protein